jgi:hypothetical protein
VTYKLVNGQKVDLGKRVLDTEDLGEVVDNLVSTLEGQLALLLEASGGVNSDRQVLAVVLASGKVLDVLKVTESPSQEVGAHDRGTVERNDLGARLVALLDFLLGHVGQGGLILWNLNLEVESCLEVGLIEAGEGSASIARLELSGQHVVVFRVSGDRGGGRDGRLVL